MESARRKAQKLVDPLDMGRHLQEKKCWDNSPNPTLKEEHIREDDKEDADNAETLTHAEVIPQLLEEMNAAQVADNIASGTVKLTKVEVIDKGLCDHLSSLHKSAICWSVHLFH